MSLMTLILAAALGLNHAAASSAAGRETARHQAVPAPADSVEPQEPGRTQAPDYAQREVQAKDLESFTGGHEMIIVSSCVVVLILVLILI